MSDLHNPPNDSADFFKRTFVLARFTTLIMLFAVAFHLVVGSCGFHVHSPDRSSAMVSGMAIKGVCASTDRCCEQSDEPTKELFLCCDVGSEAVTSAVLGNDVEFVDVDFADVEFADVDFVSLPRGRNCDCSSKTNQCTEACRFIGAPFNLSNPKLLDSHLSSQYEAYTLPPYFVSLSKANPSGCDTAVTRPRAIASCECLQSWQI